MCGVALSTRTMTLTCDWVYLVDGGVALSTHAMTLTCDWMYPVDGEGKKKEKDRKQNIK
ncbi:unnamed protein product [Camellia sinensis]